MKNHFQSLALISSGISFIFLAGCETNPAVDTLIKSINQATTPAPSTVQPSAPSAQKRTEASVVRAEPQAIITTKSQEFVADNRIESTGLLGKTLTSKIRYSKYWHGDLPFFNAYKAFEVTPKKVLPRDTNILYLSLDTKSTNKNIFAFVKGDTSKAYFIDIIEIDLPKNYKVLYHECEGGNLGLFSESNHDGNGNYRKPIKAWSVINGRFTQLKNINMMTCVDESDGI